MTAPTLATREATAADTAFVMATWINSYLYMKRDRIRAYEAQFFRKNYIAPIKSQQHRIMVLCSPDSPTTLHGHAVATSDGLAWVFVTKDLRRMGYGRQLITAILGKYDDTIHTHWRAPFESKRFVFHELKGKVA